MGIIISKLFGRGSGGPLLIISAIILAPFLFILPFIFLGGAVVALPSAAASFAWDRLDSLFNDPDWKNAMSKVKAYQIPSDRENLLLYRDLWVDGKKVPSDDNAHWMNYGQMTSTVYKPPTGKHVYTFDIGREATLKETALIMACKACSANIVVIGDNPGDPATGKTLSPDEVGAYFTPTQNWRGVGVSGRQAVVNTVDLAGYGTRYLSLFIENNDLEAYVFQVLAFPPGARSNALWAALGEFDKHYRDIYEARVVQALAAASSSNSSSSSSEQAGKGNAKPLSLTPGGAGDSYYRPLVDGVKTSRLPIYPVVGNNSSPGQAGLGTSQDKAQGYRPVAMRWELNSYTRGKINQLGVSWLDKFVNPAPASASAPSPGLTPTSGAEGTLTPGAITTPGQAVVAPVSSVVLSPPVARRWKAYLLSSSENAALLEAIFSTGTGDVSQLPASSLIKDFDNPSVLSVNLSPSSPVTEPTNVNPNPTPPSASPGASASPSPATTSPSPVSSDKRDTLVVVFEDSSLSLTNLNPLPGLVGDQVAGLPLEWLSPAELYVYEQPPPAPTRPPRSALGSSGSSSSYGRGGSGKGGKYDLANGSVSADKLEAYFAKFPYTGIAGGNSLGQTSPLRPPASGGSGTENLLKGKGTFYIEMGKKYGINPAYAVAWARKETSMGTTGYAVYDSSNGVWGYNLYNISTHDGSGNPDSIWQNSKCIPPRGGPSDRFCNYSSFEDSIEEYFILLKAYYDGKILTTPGILPDQLPCPCTTPDKILYWYAPSSENDTALYIQQIKNWVDEMGATEVGSSGSNGYNGGSGGPGPGGGVGNVPAINQYDVSQYDPPYTDYDTRNSTCGTASSTMMINWISGANLRVVDVLRVQMAHPGSWVGVTANFDFLNDLAVQYGLVWGKLTFNTTGEYVSKVRELTMQGQPVIINVVGAPFYYGHFMVVVGYDDQTSTFIINDSAAIQQPGSGPGVVQKWTVPKLQEYLQGRLGPYFPAIVISKAGGGGGAPAIGPMLPAYLSTSANTNTTTYSFAKAVGFATEQSRG